MEEKLIFSSVDNVETDYLCSILKENNIPYVKKIDGAGDYLTITAGNLFNNSISIFVSEEDYEKASELIKSVNEEIEKGQLSEVPEELKDIPQEEEQEMEEMAEKTKGYLKKFINYFIVLPSIICFIIAIIIAIIES